MRRYCFHCAPGWHGPGTRLRVLEKITLLRLPPYAPELNPMESVWAYLRKNQLSMTVSRTYNAILDTCCNAWNSQMKDAERIISITTRTWAQVNVLGGWYYCANCGRLGLRRRPGRGLIASAPATDICVITHKMQCNGEFSWLCAGLYGLRRRYA